ncbi:MAG: AI-2E family transporter [Anaerolineae bacterium]|nr:AI-2E family transporter [Anaerolineae bacterium]
MSSWFSSPTKIYRTVLVGVLLAFCLAILIAARAALVPFFLGLFFAYLLLPVVDFFDRHSLPFLRRKGWSRSIAIIIVYILALGVIAGLLSSFIPAVINQARLLGEIAPEYWEQLEGVFEYATEVQKFFSGVPEEIRAAVNANLTKAVETITDTLQMGLSMMLKTISQTLSFVLGLAIIPFWLFYVFKDEAKARRAFYNLIPEKAREDVRCIAIIIDDLLSAYIRGQLLLCLLVGVMATIALLLFRVDLGLLLGTFAGIFEIIPILGPYLGAAPAVLIAFLKRPILGLWVALAFAAIQQIENILLAPRIAGNAVRFHPAVAMVLVIVGSEVAGLWGLALAVPVAAVIRDVFQYLYLRTTERGVTPQMALDNLRARHL